jgi:hypothetical protein
MGTTFLGADELVDYVPRVPKLPYLFLNVELADFVLHRSFEDTFLLANQCALLVVVTWPTSRISASPTVPPVPECLSASGATVCSFGSSLLQPGETVSTFAWRETSSPEKRKDERYASDCEEDFEKNGKL